MQHLIGKVVQFTSKIEDMEAYPEKGMRARILRVEEEDTDCPNLEDYIYKITFDYSEFDEFNKGFESANYYNHYGIPCLTAREANYYKAQEVIYFGSPKLWPFEEYFTFLDDHKNKLLKLFEESGTDSYVECLESQIQL